MIKLRAGKTKTVWLPKVASTVFHDGGLVTFTGSTSGTISPATSSTSKVVGVCRRTTSSSDSDYAQNSLIPVQVPIEKFCEWLADTSSAVAGNVGNTYDLSNDLTVNVGGTSENVVLCVGYVSATQIIVTLVTYA